MRASEICTCLGWSLAPEDEAAETYLVPDGRRTGMHPPEGAGPWLVHFKELILLDSIPPEELPLAYAVGLAHVMGPTVAGEVPMWVRSRYMPDTVPGSLAHKYLHDIVLPYLSMRMELGV